MQSIQRDVRWLGFDWKDKLFFASDYYKRLYAYALTLIRAGKAYVCSLSEEDIRKYRGTAFEPSVPSPYRDGSVDENLDLFARMRKGAGTTSCPTRASPRCSSRSRWWREATGSAISQERRRW